MSTESNLYNDVEPNEEDGETCQECGEWSLVYTNAGSDGRLYCPCCGTEWNEA